VKAEASGRFFEKKLRKKLLRLGARCASASLRAQRSNPSFAKQAIVFLLFFAALHPVYAAQEVTYEPSNVQLSGTIVYEQFYGPPNFGEDPKTDAKVNG
jgi:hypothetical protein